MRRVLALPAAVLVMLLLAACTPTPAEVEITEEATEEPTAPPPTVDSLATDENTILLEGVGASAPNGLYHTFFDQYVYVNPTSRFTYDITGSTAGINAMIEETVDFAGSDAILTDEEHIANPDIMMFPTVAMPITVIYNIPLPEGGRIGSGLQLTGIVLAGIFSGEITQWNDPAIAAENPNAILPEQDITVIHRTDGSGSTYLFTMYLSRVSDIWAAEIGAGTTVDWPVGLTALTNQHMSSRVRDIAYSIGYVDFAVATQFGLSMADVENSLGQFVPPSVGAVDAAQTALANEVPGDLGHLLVNAPSVSGIQSYPISGYSFLLFHRDMPDCQKAAHLVTWYEWLLVSGDVTATQANFTPLSDDLQELALRRLQQVTCEGGQEISTVR